MPRTTRIVVGASLIAGLDGGRAMAVRLRSRLVRGCRTALDLAVLLGLAVALELAGAAERIGSP
jgi:hypothetical protein